MSAAKKKGTKPGGMLWRWLDVVEERALAEHAVGDLPASLYAVHAVMTMRARKADADGSRSYPSRVAMAKRAGIKPGTVREVDAWLESRGFMVLVRQRWQQVKEYRLVLPPAAAVEPLEDRQHDAPVGPAVGPPVSPVGDQDLLPPNGSEEGGGEGSAARADAPPHPFTPLHRKRAARVLLAMINDGHDLDAQTLEPVLAEYLATVADGWAQASVRYRCGVILAKARTNPTAYLIKGLQMDARRGSVSLPGWAEAANEWGQLLVKLYEVGSLLPEGSEDLATHRAHTEWFVDWARHALGHPGDTRSPQDILAACRTGAPAPRGEALARFREVVAKNALDVDKVLAELLEKEERDRRFLDEL